MDILKTLLSDHNIEDIVLSPRGTLFYKEGEWQNSMEHRVPMPELWEFSRSIAENSSSTLGLTQPSVDSFWSDPFGNNFRAHVAIHPLVIRGPEVTLRRIPKIRTLKLEQFGIEPKGQSFLEKAVREGKNILVAGSTGAGKTSLITALMDFIPPKLRVLILEDSPELSPPTPFSTKLLTRQNRFGFRNGASWDLSHLVFESLRMRPDRIILGECRGSEAYGIVTALQTGHSGIMTTLHAGNTSEALVRFRQLAEQGGLKPNVETDSLWDVLVHIHQSPSGERRVHEIVATQDGSRTRII